MTDQAPARSDPRRSVVEWLNSGHIQAEIKRALPDHVPVDWFMRLAQTALLNNPNLASADKASLLRELVAVAQLGLVLDPQLGEAWLIIDRHGKVQRRVGYQGLRRLAMQSGDVTSLNAQAVYKNDRCSVTLGDSPSVKHEIDIQRGDRGPIIGYYAVARVRGIDEAVVEWMSEAQVAAHRDRYSDAYRHPDPSKRGPWGDPLAAVEMGRKTAFRRLAKWLPKSPLLAEALSDEDRADMRDVTPESGAAMLPAPDDPMDQVVATAAPRSRREPAGAAVAEPALAPSSEPAAATKRKPGRPSKAEVEAKRQQVLAQDIIDEINAADPEEVDGVLQTREEDIASLPDELRTKVVTAKSDRMAGADDSEPWDEPEPDPLDAEGKPPIGETSGSDDDGFEEWRASMEELVGNIPRDLKASRKKHWLKDAEGWGDRGIEAVEAAFGGD
jgi:phage RecT family recombinase